MPSASVDPLGTPSHALHDGFTQPAPGWTQLSRRQQGAAHADVAFTRAWESLVKNGVTFLDCPAYIDADGSVKCGLPAYVQCRYIVNSTNGPVESAIIRCPAGHLFNGPIEFLTFEKYPPTALRPAGAATENVHPGQRHVRQRHREPR